MQLNDSNSTLTFFLIKKSKKNNYTVHDNNLMGAGANPIDQSTYIISKKNCPFFPKTLTEETAPNISNYEISDRVNPLSSHIHTPHVIYTIVRSIQK